MLIRLLEIRRAIIDRAGSWEEMEAQAQILDACVEQWDELAVDKTDARPSLVRKWQGQRAKDVARARCCRYMMRQIEMEVSAWHAKFTEMAASMEGTVANG